MKQVMWMVVVSVLIMGLAACGGAAATPTSAPPTDVPPVSVPATQLAPATQAAPAVRPTDDPNTIKTTSGLKYVDLVVGTGVTPASTDWVTIEFTATLEDGTLIGASRPRGGPAKFPLDGVTQEVPGWGEGMSTMKVGGTRKLVIPPELAYGNQGASGVIPPDATLIFTIDLLNTEPAPQVDIKDTVVGTGATAATGMSITVNYTGTLTDGTVFDSSLGPDKQPFVFVLGAGEVIPGWDQGLLGMKVGGRRILTIPPELGYGSQGAGNTIPPDATLVFEVELLDAK